MDDISAIDGLTTSLRAAADITKAMKDVSDASVSRTKIYELTREIMSAHSCALAVQSQQLELLQSKRELDEEVARLKAWNTEKYRYELRSVGPGANACPPFMPCCTTVILHCRAVNLRHQAACLGKSCSVDADLVPDGNEFLRRSPRMVAAPSTDVNAELVASGVSPRLSAPMTLVVTPEECQSMPITAPKD
jgi:hypothetical protein